MARKQLIPLDLNSNRITNVADPTADQDAVTRQYLEDHHERDDLSVFYIGTSASGTRYTPSVGEIGIMKRLLATNSSSVDDYLTIRIRDVSLVTLAYFMNSHRFGPYQSIDIGLFVPVDYGESVHIASTNSTIDLYLAGEVTT